jgi:hypothetical protein
MNPFFEQSWETDQDGSTSTTAAHLLHIDCIALDKRRQSGG